MAQLFLNNFETTFIASVKDAPTSGTPAAELDYGILRISDGAAGVLINPTGGDYYILTAFKRAGTVESDLEIMKVTAVNNSTPGECRITVQRAQEGTSAKGYVAGDRLALRLTAGAAGIWLQQDDLDALEGRVVPRAGNVTMTGPLSVPAGASGAQVPQAQEVALLATTQLAGHRNKLINGDFSQDVRGLTSVADDAYCLDRWYVLTETGNVTVGKLADPESGAPWGIRLTQPDATAKRIGFAQIIESRNIRQYASTAMNLSARLRLSTAANIRYAVIEHTGTANAVTSDVVNNWASATFTPANFFIAGVNIISTGTIAPGAATWGSVSAWGALGADVRNVIVFIWTESQVAQNVTLDCSRIQYEPGVVATPHEWRINEDSLCARYARLNGVLSGWSTSTTKLNGLAVDFGSTPMFSTPAISLVTGVSKGHDPDISMRDISAPTFSGASSGGYIACTIASTTSGKLHNLMPGAILFTAEL